jgi:polar amino acid transport system substrate-binding protein
VKPSRPFLSMVAVLVLLLSGCSSQGTASPTPGALARIQAAGYITIGTSNDVPFSFMEGNNPTLQGIDAEMMQYIAGKMGVTVNVYVTDWNSLIPALQAKKFDVIVDAMWITDERKKVINFTDPWYSEGEAIVVRTDDTRITSLDNLKTMTVGVQQGSTMVPWVQSIAAQTKMYDSQALGLLDLNAGRIDALITDSASAAYVIQKDSTLKLRLVTPYKPKYAGTIGAAVRKDDTDLLAAMNTALASMKTEGKDLAILQKWGLGSDNLAH